MQVMKKILKKIKEYDKIVIYGHIRPDGDCYGSQFGLKDIIKTTFPKKEVYVSTELSDFVSFLGKSDNPSDLTCQESLSIVVDSGDSKRVSDLRFKNGKEIIKIDHHISNDLYGDINWIIEESPACSQMITDFYISFKELKMSKEGAMALYTGIVTDTGGFKYRGVTRQTHNAAGLLLELGADVEFINNKLGKTTLNEIELKGYLLNNIVKTKHFIYVCIPKEIYNKFGVSSEDAAALVNQLAGIEGFPVWALIIEYDNNEYRVRLRSSGIEINKLAEKYRGGGHAQAAGASLDSFDDAKKLAIDVDALIDEHLNINGN
ncbi:bifunctional oligoribonuclease/PAP phosphatase NrnA [Acholeplasma sp. OttesenSCG-928-E16]|nr:bifunctional oligoribonuclease/PAP phosphatase NrnA [Acholeplasma sp. OttesenSCG-928-E16]